MNLNDIWGIQEIINNLSPAAKVGDFLSLYEMYYSLRVRTTTKYRASYNGSFNILRYKLL